MNAVSYIQMLFALLVVNATFGQDPLNQADPRVVTVFREINEIRQKAGWDTLSDRHLANDITVLKGAEPDVTRRMSELSPADARVGLLWLWLRIRTTEQGIEMLTVKRLNQLAERLGAIDIQSRPKDARIEVDGIAYPEPTNRIVFENPGRHQIVLRKEGYEDVNDSVQVEGRKQVTFHRTLRKK